MLTVVIKGPKEKDLVDQIKDAVQKGAEALELRLDLIEQWDATLPRILSSVNKLKTIFTLRSKSQGGDFTGTSADAQEVLRKALTLYSPHWVDLESSLPAQFFKEIQEKHPDVKIICSYHNFENGDHSYAEMKKNPASTYKVAVTSPSTSEALRLLNWVKAESANQSIAGIGMGATGQVTRILAPIVGSFCSFCCLNSEDAVAPGQLDIHTLQERYRYSSLSSSTAVFGLIGDPVEKSVSDVTHNAIFKKMGIDAVYVKMPVVKSVLPAFFEEARKLPFSGLSVTMPLKEAIIPFLDFIDSQAAFIGAVNTLVFKQGKVFGYNTDGRGALNALESVAPVRGKTVVLLGAGGAAKAIAVVAAERGAHVVILNRTLQKAQEIADKIGGSAGMLDDPVLKRGYDVLINCTPADIPIDPQLISANAIAMDIKTRPMMTPFLHAAKDRGCKLVYGYQMFIEQAIGQYDKWFKGLIGSEACRQSMLNTIQNMNL